VISWSQTIHRDYSETLYRQAPLPAMCSQLIQASNGLAGDILKALFALRIDKLLSHCFGNEILWCHRVFEP
jgi:hypothetical protein